MGNLRMQFGIPLKPVYTPKDPAKMYLIMIAASEAGETMGERANLKYQSRS